MFSQKVENVTQIKRCG